MGVPGFAVEQGAEFPPSAHWVPDLGKMMLFRGTYRALGGNCAGVGRVGRLRQWANRHQGHLAGQKPRQVGYFGMAGGKVG